MFKVFMKLVKKHGLERAESIFRLSPAFKSAAQMRTYRVMARESRDRAMRAGRSRKLKPTTSFVERKAARVAKPTTKQARENYNKRMQAKARRDERLGETGVPMYGHSQILRNQAKRQAANPFSQHAQLANLRVPTSEALEMGRRAPIAAQRVPSFPEWMASKKTFYERKLARIKNAEKARMLGGGRSDRQRFAEYAGTVEPGSRLKKGVF